MFLQFFTVWIITIYVRFNLANITKKCISPFSQQSKICLYFTLIPTEFMVQKKKNFFLGGHNNSERFISNLTD